MQNWKYVKIFGEHPACTPTRAEIDELLEIVSKIIGGGSMVPAGYTYFGQFIDHDISFLLENTVMPGGGVQPPPTPVDQLTLARKPTLDLDSIYGGGFADSKIRFDTETGKFILGDSELGVDRDLRRDPDFQPLIGDPRNDENLPIAQVQVLFMNLHNRIIEDLIEGGERDPSWLFGRARNEVVKIYQYLVLHDFLKRLVPGPVYNEIVVKGEGRLTSPDRQNPTMALEVSDAAFRLHSMVRPKYRLNDARTVDLSVIGELTGNRKHAGMIAPPLLKTGDRVDWRFFFEFAHYYPDDPKQQNARAISIVLTPFMRALPVGQGRTVDMLEVNILRAVARGLCSGQHAASVLMNDFPAIAAKLGLRVLNGDDFVLRRLSANNSIRGKTPLWLYLMLEATGSELGPLGGWLLADTLRTAALSAEIGRWDVADPRPFDLYRPLLARAGDRSAITIEDVIVYSL